MAISAADISAELQSDAYPLALIGTTPEPLEDRSEREPIPEATATGIGSTAYIGFKRHAFLETAGFVATGFAAGAVVALARR